MAFQQPQQRPAVSRLHSLPQPTVDVTPAIVPGRKRSLAESQEWILFSPQTDEDRSRTSQTPRTATHLSDFGSLETHIRSQAVTDGVEGDPSGLGTDYDDDGAELDSLDDGLHAFHHPFSTSSNHIDQSGGAILPTHDGLGAFPSSDGFQEQLWQFERHNPHRRRGMHRRSSTQPQLDVMEEEQEEAMDPADERTARIEQWRMEQSKAVLEEIEREARRRRRHMSRMGTSIGTLPSVRETTAAGQQINSVYAGGSEHDKFGDGQQPSESFWRRITRRVIEDLIGLDETTLSVIFGEQLVDDPSPTPTQPSPIAAAVSNESRVTFQDQAPGWETKLIERIARELGILVHQFSEHPSGAFSTYVRAAQQELDYAGIPASYTRPQPTPSRLQRRLPPIRRTSDPAFAPTLAQAPTSPTDQTDTSLWGIEEEPAQPSGATETTRLDQQREYWERDVDVNMIFQYLKSRFSSGSATSTSPSPPPQSSNAQPPNGPLPPSWVNSANNTASALGTSPENLRRAEVIRRQHPLVSRAAANAQQRRRDSLLRRHHMQTLLQKRTAGSSCASHSTRRSRHSRSGSSRHYWDLGGSVGSGSGPAISSGLGGWGEV